MTQLSVTSADGTLINAQCYGAGRPLVILSGALFASELWLRVVPLITADRCAVVVDRRGRGKSGNAPSYFPEREVEDVLAVLQGYAGPVDLLGHSSGAILALEVAQRKPSNLMRLITYEPPIFFEPEDSIAADLPERLEALLARGRREEAVETFLREGPRATEAELHGMKTSSAWPAMVRGLSHTVPYDSYLQRAFTSDPSTLARIRVPTLMLLGGASPGRMRRGAQAVAARLTQVTLRELPEQQHVAMLSAPALFATAVNEFLMSSSEESSPR